MAKKKSKSRESHNQSEQVYSNRGPTNSRTLGNTLNHDHPSIPSSTFRTLEQSIPKSSLRTHDRYEWNPKTQKSKIIKEPADPLNHARDHINRGKFHTVTSGARQRYQQAEGKPEDSHYMGMGMSACYPSSSPLGGSMKNRKDRY